MAPAGTRRQCHSAAVAFKVLPDTGPLCHCNDSKSREGVSLRHTLGHILVAGGAEYVPWSASVVVVGFFHHLGIPQIDTGSPKQQMSAMAGSEMCMHACVCVN